MSIGGRIRLLTAAAVIIAPAQLLVAPTATATGSVTVVDLPPADRAQPRNVVVIGRTDDGHVVLEDDSGSDPAYLLVDPDGTRQVLDQPVGAVAGDRLVRPVGNSPTSVTTRPVTGSTWTTTDVPAGATLLDYTADGLLLRTGDPGSEQLSLLPWDGGAAEPVDGLASGVDVYAPARRVGHGSLTMLWASGTAAVVDTSDLHAWTLTPPDTDCRPDWGEWHNFGADSLAWLDNGETVLCTATIPATTGGSVTYTKRPFDRQATPYFSTYTYWLVPVGDDVVLSPWYAATAGWATQQQISLRAIGPDGTVRTLAPAGYGAQPAGPGHVVAVTGDQPGLSGLRDLDVTGGTSSEVLALDPVPATYSGIAVDGDQVYGADDSAYLGGLRSRTVDLGNGTAGKGTLLDSDVTGPVVADDGAVAWEKSGWNEKRDGHVVEGGDVAYGASGLVAATDRRWVFSSDGDLLDTSTNTVRPTYWTAPRSSGDFQDGVTYAPGRAVPGVDENLIIAADADTQVATTIAMPLCSQVSSVKVAGSWMLVGCTDTNKNSAVFVVDRTGVTPTWRLNSQAEVHLGNGFVVARTSDGTVSWSPLAGSAPDWQVLGTTAKPDFQHDDHAVAASRGSVPTVAWYAGSSAHVALLPVTTGPLPDHPTTGVRPPAAPQHVAVVGADARLRVTWDQADFAERMTQYHVAATTRKSGAVSSSVDVGGGATGVFVPKVTNGAPYDVTVTAINIAGRTTSETVTGTPVAAPSKPTDVQLTVDPVTSRGTVTWAWSQAAKTEPAASFTVSGGPVDVTVPATARSASFVVDGAWNGPLTVSADGLAQASGTTVDASFPGVDRTRPKASLTGVPAVTYRHAVTLHVAASDDRRLAAVPVDVRWRSATLGHRLGAWQRPATWQRRAPGTLSAPRLVDGETACYSVRAHDAAGNTSAWSAARCTATPLDDRALTGLRDVTRLNGTRFYRGTATRLDSGRGLLRLRGPVAVTGWVLATTCPTCGRIQVAIDGGWYGSPISLWSARRHDRVLLRIPGPVPQSGTLEIWTTGPKPAVIDALVLRAH